MRVRALDTDNDWEYGKGQNDYKVQRAAVAQNLQTRISSFFGDCFFDTNAGVDWYNLLGGKDQLALQLAVTAIILNTANIASILSFSATYSSSNRNLVLFYKVLSVFGTITQSTEIPTTYLLTENDNPLVTEDGENIII